MNNDLLLEQLKMNNSFYIEVEKQLSHKIGDPEERALILQYIKKKITNQKLIEKILNQKFCDLEEFQMIKNKYEKEGFPIEGSNNQEQIKNLFEQFKSLNQRKDEEIQNQLCQLYNLISSQKFLAYEGDFEKNPKLVYNDLLVLCKKVKQHFSFYPKPVQLLSVIELYNNTQKQGRLAEIYTGEGKTLIVAMLAVLLCKKKQINVDIVTSSTVLAIRDAKELASFYQLFSVSVAHNVRESQNYEDKPQCYKSQVIYGDSHSFQADILRHEYEELGTMGDRKTEYVIVDEVDSMLIDGNSNKTQISSSTPGMLIPTKVLIIIWHQICLQEQFCTNKKVFHNNCDGYYQIDLEEHLLETLNKLFQSGLKETIPQYRFDYVINQMKTWVKYAIIAKYDLQEKKDYIIDPEVRIIDYENTGVIHQKDTQWQNGLHQFIQLKHNLPVSPLRVSTNYLSNVGFFLKYKFILGLTGTLGSKVTQDLLANSYNVDFVFLPPHKQRLFKEYPGIATLKKDQWLEEILKVVQQQINKNRSVLLINQTIKDVNDVQQYLAKNNLTSISYIDNKQDLKKDIQPKQIIIATNLAGRGTDLITNEELERNGGLHVIMTFLPRNIRIQLQGFGRTARQGKQGTAQLILQFDSDLYLGNIDGINNLSDAIDYYQKHKQQKSQSYFDILIFFRDKNEGYYVNDMKKEMDRLLSDDKCFSKFCEIAKSKVDKKLNFESYKVLQEILGVYLEQKHEDGLNEEEVKQILNKNQAHTSKHHTMEGIKNNDKEKLKQAYVIDENDASANYHNGIIAIEEKNKEDAIKFLNKAKELVQKEMEITKMVLNLENFQQMNVKPESNQQSNENFTIPNPLQNNNQQSNNQQNNNQQSNDKQNNNQQSNNLQNNKQQSNNLQNNNQQSNNQQNNNQQSNNQQNIKQQSNNLQINNQQSNDKQNNNQQSNNLQNIKQQSNNLQNNNQQSNNQQNNNQQSNNLQNNKQQSNNLQNNNQQSNNQQNNNQQSNNLQNNNQQSNNLQNNNQQSNQKNYQKSKNHLKIYQKIFENIDHLLNSLNSVPIEDIKLTWDPTIDMSESEQCIKDQQEVVEDGPFPRLAKFINYQEKSEWWEYLGLFCIGASEIILGSVACVAGLFTLGLTWPLGSELITQGIQDSTLAVMAYWKGININWEGWKEKTIKMVMECYCTGQFLILENLKRSKVIFKSFKQISLAEYLIQIPPASNHDLQTLSRFLEQEDRSIITRLRQTLILILDKIQNMDGFRDEIILESAQQVINQQKSINAITQNQATEIYQLVQATLDENKRNPLGFLNIYCQTAQNYIKLQINNCILKKNKYQIKNDFVNCFQLGSQRKYENVIDDIRIYEQKKKDVNCELISLSQHLWDCFRQDQEIQKMIFSIDLQIKNFCDLQQVQQHITNDLLSQLVRETFQITNCSDKISFEKLRQSDMQEIKLFYQTFMRPCFQNMFQYFFQQLQIKLGIEPLQIQFEFDYQKKLKEKQNIILSMKTKIEPLLTQVQKLKREIDAKGDKALNQEILFFNQQVEKYNVQAKQIVQENEELGELIEIKSNLNTIIQYLKNIKMINNDGITFQVSFQEEFNKYMIKQQIKPYIKDFLLQVMIISLGQIKAFQKTDNIFARTVKNSIQVEIIDKLMSKINSINLKDLNDQIYSKIIW